MPLTLTLTQNSQQSHARHSRANIERVLTSLINSEFRINRDIDDARFDALSGEQKNYLVFNVLMVGCRSR